MQIREENNGNGEYRLDRRVVKEQIPKSQNSVGINRKIGVVSIARGCGATTIAYAATEHFAQMYNINSKKKKLKNKCAVSFVEINSSKELTGFSYDKIGIEQRFAGREFISFAKLIDEGKPIAGLYNISDGINWVLNVPGREAVNPAGYIRLIENIDTVVKICDIVPFGDDGAPVKNTQNMEAFKSILATMHKIICVIDPLPSKLLAGIPVFEMIRMAEANGIPVTYVINKMNKGVNMREIRKFLNINEFCFMQTIDNELIYSAEFECRSILSDEKVHKSITEIFPL